MDYPLFPLPPSLHAISSEHLNELDLCDQSARQGDLEKVKKHVQNLLRGPEAAPLAQLNTPLSVAAQNDHVEVVRYLLDLSVTKELPFEDAVRNRAIDVLELLIEYGWDIDAPLGRMRPPPLSIPLCQSDRDLIDWFLAHGADPNACCAWDYTPMSEAMLESSLEIIDYLFQRGAKISLGQLLHHAVVRGRSDTIDLVHRLVHWGEPINEIRYANDSVSYNERISFGLGAALHRAAEFGKSDIVEFLLQEGADPFLLDTKNRTPRFWAEEKGHAQVADVLAQAEMKRLEP